MVRSDKTLKIGLVVAGAVVLMALTIRGAIWVSNIDNRKAAALFPKCEGKHAAHQVVIQNDKVIPAHTTAARCDTMVITNLDDAPRIMAFGPHEHHVAYDGVTERYLDKNGTFTVTLVQPGNFLFHDHDDDTVRGTFAVSP